jgi:hypothetical protein
MKALVSLSGCGALVVYGAPVPVPKSPRFHPLQIPQKPKRFHRDTRFRNLGTLCIRLSRLAMLVHDAK